MDEKPKLRPVEAIPYDSGGERLICLRDPAGLTKKVVALPPRAFFLAALCDGQHTLRDMQAEYMRRFGDLIFIEKIEEMIGQLDEALLLESERFRERHRALTEEFRRATVRLPSHAGTAYPLQPQPLRQMLDAFFTAENGPGKIDRSRRGPGIAAVAAPHIDLRRGGVAYAHAWKELAERCAAETFVILGVAHTPLTGLFAVTDKDFETPLGAVPCDRGLARGLMRRAGLEQGDDELVHRSEHSVEFQAVFLRHVFGASRPARIVPVLCGLILEAMGDGTNPLEVPAIADFVGALRELLKEGGDRVAVIASADLSHVGRRFNDQVELTPELLTRVETEDRALLKHAERMDAAAFFETNCRDKDRRHVCGFSALYALLAAVPARSGRLLHYGQAPERETQSVVSFAAMAFEK